MLTPSELHSLWSTLNEDRRLDFLASLTQEAVDQLFAYQLREHERQLAMQRLARQRCTPFDGTEDAARDKRREANRLAQARHREQKRTRVGANID